MNFITPTNHDPRPLTQVAVAILINPRREVLFAQRPQGKPYAGYWEFPGGKVEKGETLEAACVREIQEELGITITAQRHWTIQTHVYPHAHVALHFQLCTAWLGDLTQQGLEGQALAWQSLSHEPLKSILLTPLLPALLVDDAQILRALHHTIETTVQ